MLTALNQYDVPGLHLIVTRPQYPRFRSTTGPGELAFSNLSFPAKQFPNVVESGSSRKEATASPTVTKGSAGLFQEM